VVTLTTDRPGLMRAGQAGRRGGAYVPAPPRRRHALSGGNASDLDQVWGVHVPANQLAAGAGGQQAAPVRRERHRRGRPRIDRKRVLREGQGEGGQDIAGGESGDGCRAVVAQPRHQQAIRGYSESVCEPSGAGQCPEQMRAGQVPNLQDTARALYEQPVPGELYSVCAAGPDGMRCARLKVHVHDVGRSDRGERGAGSVWADIRLLREHSAGGRAAVGPDLPDGAGLHVVNISPPRSSITAS